LKEAVKNPGQGTQVPLCTTMHISQGLSDIYLKHPGDESSEDEEGTEIHKDDLSDDGEYRILFSCLLFYYQSA
jgi:hypothetical protein